MNSVATESYPNEWFPLTIAIDGPSGSGKSTQARRLAARLNIGYLDTGAMYRAVAWHCVDCGIDLADQNAVTQAAKTADLRVELDPHKKGVFVGAVDVTEQIRLPEISAVVSQVAVNPTCREVLITRQRELIAECGQSLRGVVAEGRDITTVVAPDAPVRILLTAAAEARVARRAADLAAEGGVDDALLAQTYDQVVGRDETDAAAADFLTPSAGVYHYDSSASEPEDTAAALLAMVETALAQKGTA